MITSNKQALKLPDLPYLIGLNWWDLTLYLGISSPSARQIAAFEELTTNQADKMLCLIDQVIDWCKIDLKASYDEQQASMSQTKRKNESLQMFATRKCEHLKEMLREIYNILYWFERDPEVQEIVYFQEETKAMKQKRLTSVTDE